ncbi:MAG TPA: family 20 glycosylhydrolase, partial [Bacteroidota bacterium]|nr:family 20 glycosylhydrolase [Bacteroidota bacterium]
MTARLNAGRRALLVLIFLVAFAAGPAAIADPAAAAVTGGTSPISIIPRPRECTAKPGSFVITRKTGISVQREEHSPFAAEYLAVQLRAVTGYPLELLAAHSGPADNVVSFRFLPGDSLGSEAYTLDVTSKGVRIRASTDAGAFYAVQTLMQLLPPNAYGTRKRMGLRWTIPCAVIADSPRFPWRGLHLDVSRHFFPPSFIYRLIDLMALHKLNVFHWHLTDDQGWRIEIRKFPRLTSVGAWRADREGIDWNLRQPQHPGEPATYGGFYTQEEIRAIVRYAAERNVTIVPEIEMPAH